MKSSYSRAAAANRSAFPLLHPLSHQASLHPRHKNNLHACDTGRPQSALALDSAVTRLLELSLSRSMAAGLALAARSTLLALAQARLCTRASLGRRRAHCPPEAWPDPNVGTCGSMYPCPRRQRASRSGSSAHARGLSPGPPVREPTSTSTKPTASDLAQHSRLSGRHAVWLILLRPH